MGVYYTRMTPRNEYYYHGLVFRHTTVRAHQCDISFADIDNGGLQLETRTMMYASRNRQWTRTIGTHLEIDNGSVP